MSVLTRTELEKLSVMYEGDKNRDATSKIRGFLFQDYVAIMSLLKNQVKYICLEYLEDDTFEIIQVKYYPKTSPKMKEISTDLYYQYLRLQMLQSTLNDFSIEMTKTLEREVSIMCNLSKGVEEKGIEKGILLSIRNLMETMGWSVEQAMEGLKIPEEEKTKYLYKIIYVFLTIFLYLLKCPQSLILWALRAFCICGKPHISRSIFLYFRYQTWLKSW